MSTYLLKLRQFFLGAANKQQQPIIIIILTTTTTTIITTTFTTTNMTKAPATNKQLHVTIKDEMEKHDQETPPVPLTMAYNIITTTVEPHPAPIHHFCTAIFHKFSTLKNKECQQLDTLDQLTKDSFLPCSAQLAFDLHTTNKVMETEEFKTLAASMVVAEHPLCLDFLTRIQSLVLVDN